MSYKTELQSNNNDLQDILDGLDELPDAVNLDTEISEQDSIIVQIVAELVGKAAGGSDLLCSVTIRSESPIASGKIHYVGINGGNAGVITRTFENWSGEIVLDNVFRGIAFFEFTSASCVTGFAVNSAVSAIKGYTSGGYHIGRVYAITGDGIVEITAE